MTTEPTKSQASSQAGSRALVSVAMRALDAQALGGSVTTAQYFRWRRLAHESVIGAAQVLDELTTVTPDERSSPTAEHASEGSAARRASGSSAGPADDGDQERPQGRWASPGSRAERRAASPQTKRRVRLRRAGR